MRDRSTYEMVGGIHSGILLAQTCAVNDYTNRRRALYQKPGAKHPFLPTVAAT
jgi:hypothetical protein